MEEGTFTLNDFKDRATFLGDDPEVPDVLGIDFTKIPSRIVSSVLDVGVLEKDVSKKPGSNAKDYQRTAMFRYQYLSMQTLNMTVPLNTSLQVGNVIKCNFLKISTNSKEFDRENSGLYMIKELCHHFDGTQSLTSMKLLRDTFGD